MWYRTLIVLIGGISLLASCQTNRQRDQRSAAEGLSHPIAQSGQQGGLKAPEHFDSWLGLATAVQDSARDYLNSSSSKPGGSGAELVMREVAEKLVINDRKDLAFKLKSPYIDQRLAANRPKGQSSLALAGSDEEWYENPYNQAALAFAGAGLLGTMAFVFGQEARIANRGVELERTGVRFDSGSVTFETKTVPYIINFKTSENSKVATAKFELTPKYGHGSIYAAITAADVTEFKFFTAAPGESAAEAELDDGTKERHIEDLKRALGLDSDSDGDDFRVRIEDLDKPVKVTVENTLAEIQKFDSMGSAPKTALEPFPNRYNIRELRASYSISGTGLGATGNGAVTMGVASGKILNSGVKQSHKSVDELLGINKVPEELESLMIDRSEDRSEPKKTFAVIDRANSKNTHLIINPETGGLMRLKVLGKDIELTTIRTDKIKGRPTAEALKADYVDVGPAGETALIESGKIEMKVIYPGILGDKWDKTAINAEFYTSKGKVYASALEGDDRRIKTGEIAESTLIKRPSSPGSLRTFGALAAVAGLTGMATSLILGATEDQWSPDDQLGLTRGSSKSPESQWLSELGRLMISRAKLSRTVGR